MDVCIQLVHDMIDNLYTAYAFVLVTVVYKCNVIIMT